MVRKCVVLVSKDSELCGLVVGRLGAEWPCTVINDWRLVSEFGWPRREVWVVDLALGQEAIRAVQTCVRSGGAKA